VKFADIMPLVMIRAGQAGHRTVAGRIEALTPLKTEPWREAILIGGWSYSPVVLRCPGTAGCELSPQTSRNLLGGGGCLLPAPMGLNNLDILLRPWGTMCARCRQQLVAAPTRHERTDGLAPSCSPAALACAALDEAEPDTKARPRLAAGSLPFMKEQGSQYRLRRHQ
jgi:hypothetical protein